MSTASSAPPSPSELKFQLICSQNEPVWISSKAISLSATLSTCVSNLGYSAENLESHAPIPVSNFSEPTMKRVIQWCEHHKNDVIETGRATLWDENLLKPLEHTEMFELICAANFLDIKGLLEMSCRMVAGMVKGKGPEEILRIFQIPTDEEEEAGQSPN